MSQFFSDLAKRETPISNSIHAEEEIIVNAIPEVMADFFSTC